MPTGQREPQSDLDAVLAANRAFYDAFESRDLDEMSDVWDHADHVTCVHPGWPILTGWGAVSASWFALFSGPQHLQFILTDDRAVVAGDSAWVTCSENLIDDGAAESVAATNVFVRVDERWKLVHHHGSPVARRAQPVGET